MKHLFIKSLVVVLFFQITNVQAQNAETYFKNSHEVYFSFQIQDKAELSSLDKVIYIDEIDINNTVYAYANQPQFENFVQLPYTYTILTRPSELIHVKMFDVGDNKATYAWDSYPTYAAYLSFMAGFASSYPSLCRIDTIGVLNSGRLILAAVISDNVHTDENEPEFFYTGTMHGDETTGYVLLLHFIDELLSEYGTNTRITNLVNNIEIYINPLSNPDGTFAGGNNNINGATRTNANGIDINRNYADPDDGQHPDGNAWQEETVFFMQYAADRNFVASANFHGGAEVVNYPWDTWNPASRPTADDNWWVYVSKNFADTAIAYGPGGLFMKDIISSGYINGYDWYSITGGRQDYINYWHYCREVTIELSSVKLVSETALVPHWNYHSPSLFNYMEEVLYGFRGVITDACTFQPIRAKVFISTHDVDSSHVYSSLAVGNYHRLIEAGTYNVTYSAPGYTSQTHSVSVTTGGSTIRNVQLSPIAPIANFVADNTSSCTGVVQFTNLSAASSGTTWEWNFGDGNTSTQENPVHAYANNGMYNVKLKAISVCTANDSIIKNSYITINMPNSPAVTSASRCGTGSLTLSASGSAILNWYNMAIGGSLVNTGATFITPLLSTTTTYYVENYVAGNTSNIGPANNSIGGGGYFNSVQSLVFDVFTPAILKELTVYNQTAGNKDIIIKNSSSTTIWDTSIYVATGQQRLVLNAPLVVGTDFEITTTANSALYRNNSGTAYPYTVSGIASITRSTAGTNPTGFYYFFYDWEIEEEGCSSARIPVVATVTLVPTADYSYSTASYQANFTDLSLDASSYSWDFGDGNTSTQTNPSHTYASTGTYNVKQAVTNVCGEDSIVKQVLISLASIDDEDNQIIIYPNPASSILYIENNAKDVINNISIFDISGREIYQETIKKEENIQIDVSSYKQGVYFIKILLDNNLIVKQIIVQ
jgi:PKD repeat protein